MVFQNRKDNFEEVYFLNGNIYPLSTSEIKKRVSAVEPENHLENIKKACILSLPLYVSVNVWMYIYVYGYACICVPKKK